MLRIAMCAQLKQANFSRQLKSHRMLAQGPQKRDPAGDHREWRCCTTYLGTQSTATTSKALRQHPCRQMHCEVGPA